MDNNKRNCVFKLNNVSIDPIANQVTRDGETLDVTPKVIQILQYFASSNGELVSYQDLADNVWNGFVSESALYQQMTQLRKVLGDNPSKPVFVKTVPRQGYRLIARVSFEEQAAPETSTAPTTNAAPQVASINTAAPDASSSNISSDNTSDNTSNNTAPHNTAAAPSRLKMALPIAIVLLLGLGIWLFTSSSTTDHTNGEPTVSHFDNQLIYPERTVALELFNRMATPVQPQLRATLERITEFHLGQRPRQHVIRSPDFDAEFFYQQLNGHLNQRGNLAYILRTEIEENDDSILMRINLFAPQSAATDMQQLGSIETRFDRNNPGAQLPEFERALLQEFQRLALTPADAKPILIDDVASNQALIEALSPWASSVLSQENVEQGIAASERALSLNPNNQIAYSVLFNEISWLLNSFDGDFDVDRTLKMLQARAQEALLRNPTDFKALHAMAAYHCWLDELPECANWLEQALAMRPYDSRLLRTLEDYLSKTDQNTLALAQYNYYMHPFTGGSLYYYRNVLISEGKLSQAIKLVGNHTFRKNWDTWGPVWRLESQKQARIDQLEQTASWYRDHYLALQSNNPDGIDDGADDRLRAPSRYLGYQLLNANQPELARYWNNNGRERNSQFFDLNTLQLLSNLWQGQWDPATWRSVRDLANNRNDRLNSFDQLRIAFFDYYAGHMNQASASLLAIYPEFDSELNSEDLVIDRDNFRPAVYYAEIQKRQNNYKQSANINSQLRHYLTELGDNPERDLDFGIADAEFFALNNDKEKAISLLQKAIHDRGWLPNAYWLWLPLEQNPFLSSLRDQPEFIELNAELKTKLAQLCFKESC